MYSIEFTTLAEKQFSKLPSDVQHRIVSALERLRLRPQEHVVKLVGVSAYKFRIGDYRAICTIDYATTTIYILKIGHRKNVYD